MKRYVLFHANCYDGFGAAFAAAGWAASGDTPPEMIPVAYGQPLPQIQDGSEVAILDFSYPRAVLVALAARCASLIVLDHHETAQADLAGLPFARFDMNKSGAILAWEFFHPGKAAPLLLQYVQDRDLWRFYLPKSREVAAALRSYPMDLGVWMGLGAKVELLQAEGVTLLRAQMERVLVMADEAVLVNIGGFVVPCANATVDFSEVGDELCRRHPDKPFAAYYMDQANGMRRYGLRSRGDFNVADVAKAYGGGGHKGAAGFVMFAPRAQLDIFKGVPQ